MSGRKISMKDLEKIIDKYFSKDDISLMLEKAGLKKSGTKKEIIKRLLNESEYDIEHILMKLYKNKLLEICKMFQIKVDSRDSKDIIIEKIVSAIEMKPSTEAKEVRISKKIFNRIIKDINRFEPYKVENERDLEKQLYQYLRGCGYKVTPQSAGVTYGQKFIPDLVIENIAIELKHIKSPSQIRDAIAQAIDYKVRGYSTVLLVLYGKISKEDIEKYENESSLQGIHIITI